MACAAHRPDVARPGHDRRGRRIHSGGSRRFRIARPKFLADQHGATLVELMVALILLSIALTGMGAAGVATGPGMGGAMAYGVHPVVAGGFQTTATLLSQQGIDEARNTLYSNLTTLTSTGGTGSCGGGSGTFVTLSGFGGFQRCIDVQVGTSTTTVTVVTRYKGVGGVGAGTIYDSTLVTIVSQ